MRKLEYINKYELVDLLEKYSDNCESNDSKYIKLIANILSSVIPMCSTPQFHALFKEICIKLNVNYKKWLN